MEPWHQERREVIRGPSFIRPPPPTPPLPLPHLLTHLIPSAPNFEETTVWERCCLRMLKTCDPPFPIYALFLLLVLCQSAQEKKNSPEGTQRCPGLRPAGMLNFVFQQSSRRRRQFCVCYITKHTTIQPSQYIASRFSFMHVHYSVLSCFWKIVGTQNPTPPTIIIS